MPLQSTNDNDTQETMNYSNVLKFTYTFGIPAVIAIYLIWFVVAVVNNQLAAIDSNLRQHQSDMGVNLKTNEELRIQLVNTNQILQRICVNTAANQNERNSCFASRNPGQ